MAQQVNSDLQDLAEHAFLCSEPIQNPFQDLNTW